MDAAATPEYGATCGREHGQSPALSSVVQDEIVLRLARVAQRYTPLRRALVDALARAGRPLTVPEIVAAVPQLPQSSAYRNVTALLDAGIVQRVAGTDDHGRFELAEELAGHHHHLICTRCGQVEDLRPSVEVEQALAKVASAVADEEGFDVAEHRLDLVGVCASCQQA